MIFPTKMFHHLHWPCLGFTASISNYIFGCQWYIFGGESIEFSFALKRYEVSYVIWFVNFALSINHQIAFTTNGTISDEHNCRRCVFKLIQSMWIKRLLLLTQCPTGFCNSYRNHPGMLTVSTTKIALGNLNHFNVCIRLIRNNLIMVENTFMDYCN